MALLTAGTSTTTVLRALQFQSNMGSGASKAADLASLTQLIKGQGGIHRVDPTAFDQTGILYLPGRKGTIQCAPGDYVYVDPVSGWPIVISAYAVSQGSFVHS